MFQRNKFQDAALIRFLSSTKWAQSMKMFSGDGKSYQILGAAKYYLDKEESVLIVVLYEWLLDQMQDIVDSFLGRNADVEIVLITELTYWTAKGKIVFIDEADEVLDSHMVGFKQFGQNYEMNSLLTVKDCKRLYFLSATMDSFHAAAYEQLF